MPVAPPPPFVQVMDELIKGHEFATQLQELLRDSPKAGHIMDQILHAFSRAIHAAKAAAGTVAGEGSEAQSEVTCAGGTGGGKRKAAAGGGERRGACRRRTQQLSVVTMNMKNMEDGLAWRKYGQKDIQNSIYPRSYFRCTHKFDQQCMAQRQVQRCDEDPDTLRVTYIGVHTCREPIAAVPHVIDQTGAAADDGLHAGCHIISFTHNAGAAAIAATPGTTTSTTTTMTVHTNQAGKDAATGSGMLQSLKLEGGDQEEVLSSLTPGSSAVRSTAAAAAAGPDQGDVTSTLHSYDGYLDMGVFFDDGVFDLDDSAWFQSLDRS